jgi:hypothetical protein
MGVEFAPILAVVGSGVAGTQNSGAHQGAKTDNSDPSRPRLRHGIYSPVGTLLAPPYGPDDTDV